MRYAQYVLIWMNLTQSLNREKNTKKFTVKQKHNEYNLCFKEIVCNSYLVNLFQMVVYQITVVHAI